MKVSQEIIRPRSKYKNKQSYDDVLAIVLFLLSGAKHIEKDIMLAYKYLTIEWAEYMKYLSEEYPVLYCKALINNPFDTRSKGEKDKCYLKEYKKQYKDN